MFTPTFNITLALKFESSEQLEWISDVLGLSPSLYFPKTSAKTGTAERNQNVWVYKKKICGYTGDASVCINEFLESIPNISQKLEYIGQYAKCIFRLSIVSEWAQIGFFLTPKDMDSLSRLSIPLEVSIFSWGNCEKE